MGGPRVFREGSVAPGGGVGGGRGGGTMYKGGGSLIRSFGKNRGVMYKGGGSCITDSTVRQNRVCPEQSLRPFGTLVVGRTQVGTFEQRQLNGC